MGTFIGFMVGYVLGARAGREKYEELLLAWEALKGTAEFQALVTLGTTLLGSEAARENMDRVRIAWEAIQSSPDFQSLLVRAMSVLERFVPKESAEPGDQSMGQRLGKLVGSQIQNMVTEVIRQRQAA
jgi:hypothetical protein